MLTKKSFLELNGLSHDRLPTIQTRHTKHSGFFEVMERVVPKNFLSEPFFYHQEIELSIHTLTNQGHGLGRIDGWVIMVRFALPGERVRVRIFKNHKNYSEADLVEVLDRSSDRVDPLCPFFQMCGGCQYQHLAYSEQLKWKKRHVEETFRYLGRAAVLVEPTWPSPRVYNYRSKLTPHYNPPNEGPFKIGFLREGARRQLVDIPHCVIATEAINEALGPVRAELAQRSANLKRAGTILLRDVAEGVVTDSSRLVTQQVGNFQFKFISGEFFQNNSYILPAFAQYVVDQAREGGSRYLIDAYCGVGLFGIVAARFFEGFIGVEVNARAIELARSNAELNGITNGHFVLGQSQAIFAHVNFLPSQTAVVLDPPRKGCDELFLRQLVAHGPARIVYVACDVATQARDLKLLIEAGYTVTRVQPFDLFPQTKHIENVATLVRN